MSWQDKLRQVEPYVAGEQPKINNMIKLNTNENPYGPCKQIKDILKEIVLASDKNVKKRKFATGLSSVMAVIMLIYTILCFMNSRIGYGIIGLLFSVFFIWIIINGANTFQKK
mgnify:FL=1